MMTTTTTITMIDAGMMDGEGLARLLCVASPAFPTGGFAYSHGLEWAVQGGEIRDRVTLQEWLGAILQHGAGRADAILLRHAYRAAGDAGALSTLAELAAAASPSAERQLETLAQGEAFARAAAVLGGDSPQAAYPVAFGAYAACAGIGEDAACIGHLTAFMQNLVSAGVRLVPLGQSDGLRVVAALLPIVLAVASQSRDATLDDIGGACFSVDIACMLHETQYSRMFRS